CVLLCTHYATIYTYTLSLHDALPISKENLIAVYYYRWWNRHRQSTCYQFSNAASKASNYCWTQFNFIRRNPIRLSISYQHLASRSEERRVGKECRSRWSPDE